MPLEALRYDVTPIGMHYVLTHFDVPYVDEAKWRLQIDGRVKLFHLAPSCCEDGRGQDGGP